MTPSHSFLFVGNGSYMNRGCEAIVRGTMAILRKEFGGEIAVTAGVLGSVGLIQHQNELETDPTIRSFPIAGTGPRLSLKWWAGQANRRLGTSFSPEYWDLKSYLGNSEVALEIGGDNYSLDYGKPKNFLALDRFIQTRGVPLVLWGASVGPFDADPEFLPQIIAHLRSFDAILVRESCSLEYLQRNGVSDNVHLVADPAFVMDPVEPSLDSLGFKLPDSAIGINLSPLVARYREQNPTSSNLDQWHAYCVGLLQSIGSLGLPVILVPHVQSDRAFNDDFSFLEDLFRVLGPDFPVPVHLVPRGLSAAELKHVISRCVVFAGARTHSTIAALSTCVPTLSIGYSIKARGINQDIFGHLDHCISINDLDPDTFRIGIAKLLKHAESIRNHLEEAMPGVKANAFKAGNILRQVIEKRQQR